MTSFYAGRFQPFHAGHAAIIDALLAEGKTVCVAIRNTPLSDKNPYTRRQRTEMIRRRYPDEHRVIIIGIPDIEEVVYGRDVGYTFREMKMAPEIEAISATKIRALG